MAYSHFLAEAGGKSDPTDFRKNCQLAVQVSYPQGPRPRQAHHPAARQALRGVRQGHRPDAPHPETQPNPAASCAHRSTHSTKHPNASSTTPATHSRR
ncbi:DUF4360 domain-containing protein [Lentzea albidocapillata]|uniref:DUF4360 domain-containing protein n=1 Tax=Lentzea albidocapillata TaxID=40571 RepID=UPI003B84978C